MVKEDIEILEDMLMSLVDLLVEKGMISHDEYDIKVEQRIKKSKELTRFDDLEE